MFLQYPLIQPQIALHWDDMANFYLLKKLNDCCSQILLNVRHPIKYFGYP